MYVVLDLETTGTSPQTDSIIEYAFVKVDSTTHKEIERFHGFCNPGIPIPVFINRLTHISQSDIEDSPVFEEVKDQIRAFIEGCILVGHNISFDLSFLKSHGIDTSNHIHIDTFILANFLSFDCKSLNLGFLCESCNISLHSAHRAIDDTLATKDLFFYYIQKIQSLSGSKQDIITHFFSFSGDLGIQHIYKSYCTDIKTLTTAKDFTKLLLLISKKQLDKVEKREYTNLDVDTVYSSIKAINKRENQKKMIDIVDKTFSKGLQSVIEAPTGTGKTYGYLIPAIVHAHNFREPVYISTTTKILQDQIFYKDLQFLKEHTDISFSYTKLKGKSNYLSLHELSNFYKNFDRENVYELSFIIKICFWLQTTEFGELDELQYYGKEFSLLSNISALSEETWNEKNIFYNHEFAIIARNKAKISDIIITNNNIVMSNNYANNSILGDIKNIVIDEGHNLEDCITNSYKKSLSYDVCERICKSIGARYSKLEHIFEKLGKLLLALYEVFSEFESMLFTKTSQNTNYRHLNIYSQTFNDSLSLKHNIERCVHILDEVLSDFDTTIHTYSKDMSELENIRDFLYNYSSGFDDTSYIYFIALDTKKEVYLHYTLLSPANYLIQDVWLKFESVVLTSATLSMDNNFDYITKTLGLQAFDRYTIETNFDYSKQAFGYIPTSLGSIKYNLSTIIDFFIQFMLSVKGNTLFLCTSYATIKELFNVSEPYLQKENIHILAQGINGGKQKHLESFYKHSENSVLIGTDSFWEGVDISEGKLKYLIIHKIPFPVPTDPIFKARSKLYSDSFYEYSIPKAVIKLKQGFGRLIRSQDDVGVCIILDDRVYTSSWGKYVLKAFPDTLPIKFGSAESILHLLDQK